MLSRGWSRTQFQTTWVCPRFSHFLCLVPCGLNKPGLPWPWTLTAVSQKGSHYSQSFADSVYPLSMLPPRLQSWRSHKGARLSFFLSFILPSLLPSLLSFFWLIVVMAAYFQSLHLKLAVNSTGIRTNGMFL